MTKIIFDCFYESIYVFSAAFSLKSAVLFISNLVSCIFVKEFLGICKRYCGKQLFGQLQNVAIAKWFSTVHGCLSSSQWSWRRKYYGGYF